MYKYFGLVGFLPMLVFLFGSPYTINAQIDYQEGYVVTNTNDTLYGLIKDRKTGAFGKLYKKIRFKGKKSKSKYGPKQIVSYKKGETNFETLQLIRTGHFLADEYEVSPKGDYQFLKVVASGHVIYYQMEFEDADSGYIDTIAFFKKKVGANLVRVNQGVFGLKRRKLAAFFSDCPDLAQRIRTKRIKNAIEIVDFYNNCKSENP